MASNNVALTAIGIACIAAAGAGGYYALRQNATPATSPASTVAASTPATVSAPSTPAAEPPVQETEAVVTPAPKAVKPVAPKPAPKPEKTDSVRGSNPPALSRTWPSSAAQAALPQPTAPDPVPAPPRSD